MLNHISVVSVHGVLLFLKRGSVGTRCITVPERGATEPRAAAAAASPSLLLSVLL